MRPSHVALALMSAVAPTAAATPTAAAPTAAAPTTGPAPTTGAHCVTAALPRHDLEGGQRSTLRCYERFDEAMASVGMSVGRSATPGSVRLGRSSGVAAVHYDGANGSGGSLTVTASSCNEYGVQLESDWNNRISSTTHGLCGLVKHFDGGSYNGTNENTTGGWGAIRNLGTLSNDVSSILYYEG